MRARVGVKPRPQWVRFVSGATPRSHLFPRFLTANAVFRAICVGFDWVRFATHSGRAEQSSLRYAVVKEPPSGTGRAARWCEKSAGGCRALPKGYARKKDGSRAVAAPVDDHACVCGRPDA